MITPEQIAKLREVAQKATDGPWTFVIIGPDCRICAKKPDGGRRRAIQDLRGESLLEQGHDSFLPNNQGDWDFIATFNPTLILELLDAAQRPPVSQQSQQWRELANVQRSRIKNLRRCWENDPKGHGGYLIEALQYLEDDTIALDAAADAYDQLQHDVDALSEEKKGVNRHA